MKLARSTRWLQWVWLGVVLGALVLGCTGTGDDVMTQTEGATMRLMSPAFEHEDAIPQQYTCDGQNASPELQWEDPPEATQSFALIVDDPDAPIGTYVHWVVYNIPADVRSLPENVPTDAKPEGALQGRNSGRDAGYTGPCPPGGSHRYFFKLYALDTMLDLAPEETDKQTLLDAMEGHVLAQGTLMGRYERQ